MTMTQEEIIVLLRTYIEEPIPEGGTESDTRFTDQEIWLVYQQSGKRIYRAASRLWRIKGTKWVAEMYKDSGAVKSYKTGDEQYEHRSPKDLMDFINAMAEQYEVLDDEEGEKRNAARILTFEKPSIDFW